MQEILTEIKKAFDEILQAVKKNDLDQVENLFSANEKFQKEILSLGDAEYGTGLLSWAVYQGNKNIVRYLIQKGADVHEKNKINREPIHFACSIHQKDSSILELLISLGANVHAKTISNWQPIHDAAELKNTEILKLLISSGANVNAKGKDNDTPIMCAIPYSLDAFITLVDAGADINIVTSKYQNSLLIIAIDDNDEIAKYILQNDKFSKLWSRPNIDGNLPIHYAAQRGKTHLLKFFSEKGLDLTVRRKNGNTILQESISQKNNFTNTKYIIENLELEKFAESIALELLLYTVKFGDAETFDYLYKKFNKYILDNPNVKKCDIYYHALQGSMAAHVVPILLKDGFPITLLDLEQAKKDGNKHIIAAKESKKVLETKSLQQENYSSEQWIKLFAHIHNDPRLVGTNLEGENFNLTINYLVKVLKNILNPNTKSGIDDKTMKDMVETLRHTEKIFDGLLENDYEIQKTIKDISESIKGRGGNTLSTVAEKHISNLASKIVTKLFEQNEILIPIGWSTKRGGHAMVGKLSRNEDGSWTLLIINTGSGINYHLKKETSKNLYCPILSATIPKEVSEKNLSEFINILITPRIVPLLPNVELDEKFKNMNFDAKKVYKNIKKGIVFLGGELTDPRHYTKKYTQGQNSGTCAWRVLMPLLEQQMKGLAFQQTLYQVRLQSILEFYEVQKKNNALDNPTVQRQLRAGLDKFSETTHKFLMRKKNGKSIISEEQAKHSLDIISDIRKSLDVSLKVKQPFILEDPSEHITQLLKEPRQDDFIIMPQTSQLSNMDVKDKKEKETKEKIEGQKNMPVLERYQTEPLKYLQDCLEIVLHNFNNNYIDAALFDIERMMLTLPLFPPSAEKFWENLKSENAIEKTNKSLDTLQSIFRTYGKLCQLKGGTVFPQRKVTVMNGLLSAKYITEQYPNNKENMSIMKLFLSTFESMSIKSISMTSRDPIFDKRLKSLKDIEKQFLEEVEKRYPKLNISYVQTADLRDIELIKKHGLVDELNKLMPQDTDFKRAFDDIDRARIQLYNIANGKIKNYEKKLFEPLLQEFKFSLKFASFCLESKKQKAGNFQYFMGLGHDKQDNLFEKMKYDDASSSFTRWTFEGKSNFDFNDGIDKEFREEASEETLDKVYGFEEPILKKWMFKSYSSTNFIKDERSSNLALIGAHKILQEIDRSRYPNYPKNTLALTSTNSYTRIMSTIDFFDVNLNYLNERDYQQLFFVNIMSPGCLYSQIERSEMMLNRLMQFLEMGLNYYFRGAKMEPGGFFFLMLSYYLQKYLKGSDNPEKYLVQIKRLESMAIFIKDKISDQKKIMELTESDSEKRITKTYIKDLEMIGLLINSLNLRYKSKWVPEDLSRIFKGIFHKNMVATDESYIMDPFIDEEWDNQLNLLRPHLIRQIQNLNTEEQEKLIRSQIRDFLIPGVLPNENYKIQLEFPLIKISHTSVSGILVIDFSKGQIKNSHSALVQIPREFYTADFIKYFGKKNREGKMMIENGVKICEFKDQGRLYRVIIDNSKKTRIQTKFSIEKSWYELQNKLEIKILDSSKFLPKHWLDLDHDLWANSNDSIPNRYLLTNKQCEYLANIKREGHFSYTVQELNKEGTETDYRLIPADEYAENDYYFLKYLTKFEHSNFIEVWKYQGKSSQKPNLKISFPRYGLQFESVIKDNKFQLHCVNYPGFYLSNKHPDSISQISDGLSLENFQTKETLFLIPKKDYFPTGADAFDGEYYQLELDVGNLVSEKILKKTTGEWRFKDSENFVVYRFDSKNNPKASNVSDFLYLAYLYLANHQTNKAFDALKKCEALGGIKGTIEEINLIRKIMIDIPSKVMEFSDKARTNEPDTLAVRLKAGSLLANYKSLHFEKPNFSFVEPIEETNNSVVKKKILNEIEIFYNTSFPSSPFPHPILDTYRDYNKVLGNVPEEMRLSPEQELLLLRNIFENVPRESVSNSAYGDEVIIRRWRELELAALRKEQIILQKKLQQEKQLNEKSKKRLEFVTKILQTGNPYPLNKSQIKIVSHSYSFEQRLLDKKDIDLIRNNEPLLPSKLSLTTSKKEFMSGFLSLYEEATKKNEHEKGYLKNYINARLRMWAITKAPQPQDSVTNLCIFLNIIIENPARNWPEIREWNINEKTFSELFKLAFETDKTIKTINVKKYESRPVTRKINLQIKDSDIVLESMKKDLKTKQETILCLSLGIPEISNYFKSIQDVKIKSERETKSVLDKRKFTDRFFLDEIDKITSDLSEGVRINQEITKKRAISEKTFSDLSLRKKLKEKLTEKLLTDHKNLDSKKKTLLEFANMALTGKSAELPTRLKIAAGRKPLKMSNLITLYLQGDYNLFMNRTDLKKMDAQKLYQMIHDYLLDKTAYQQKKRVMNALDALGNKTQESPGYENDINILGEQLAAKREYEPHLYPEMLVFESLEDKNIREAQVKMITKLLKREGEGYANEVIKLIMGGGKSKVIMPLLALAKANGTNLSIIEVPASLFETNLADLQTTSQKLFSQKGFPFKFKRHYKLSSSKLREIYKKMRQCITERDYVITTSESVQAFELRYIELLQSKAMDSKEWEEQIQYMDKILKIFKHRGDALLDEIHHGLDPKRELNHPLGGEFEIPEIYLKHSMDLYKIFPDIKIQKRDGVLISLEEILHEKKELPKENWDSMIGAMIEQFIKNEKSPIRDIIGKLTTEQKKILMTYFQDKSNEVPTWIRSMLERDRDRLAFVKAQVKILPLTLQRKKNVHYGFPKNPKAGVDMELAVPYKGNNTPNEGCEFGLYIEIIDYTLNLQLKKGKLSLSIIKQFIQSFYDRANEEISLSLGAKQFEETDSYQHFHELTGLNLNQFNPKNEGQLIKYLNELATVKTDHNLKTIDYCLLNFALKKIKQQPQILRSDAVNHANQFRSIQGMSGTPTNYRCYETRIKFNEKENYGIDGQTMDLLTNPKKGTKITALSETSKNLIFKLFTEQKNIDKIHAFIDVGALLTDMTNEEIAKIISLALATRKNNKQSSVLYFNENNELAAIPVERGLSELFNQSQLNQLFSYLINKTSEFPKIEIDETLRNKIVQLKKGNVQTINIGSSDPVIINSKTNSLPEQRFTFYDQIHTIGTDILQAEDAIAWLSIDKNTMAQDYYQGAMRMRNFNGSQKIEVIASKAIHDLYPASGQQGSFTCEDIAQFVLENELKKLAELHYQAAIQNMNNLLRSHFLSIISFQKNPKDKAKLYQAFSDAFLIKGIEDPFAQFGEITKEENTKEVFSNLKTEFFERWLRILSKAQMKPSDEQIKIMKNKLEVISVAAIKNCLNSVSQRTVQNQDMSVTVEKEQEKEQEKLQDLLQINRAEKGEIRDEWYRPWHFERNSIHERDIFDFTEYGPRIYPLNDMLNTSIFKPNWQFDNNIYVTSNFMDTYHEQNDKMDSFRKPLNFYLLIKDKKTPFASKIVLITPEEAQEFSEDIIKNKARMQRKSEDYVVLTPRGSVSASTDPNFKVDPNLDRAKEQLLYFDADTAMLSENSNKLEWLKTDTQSKLEFLKRIILPNYPEKNQDISSLEEAIEMGSVLKDLTQAIQLKNIKKLNEILFGLNTISTRSKRKILNSITDQDYTVLGLAINEKFSEGIELLLKFKEIDLKYPDRDGRTPLSIAIETKQNSLIKELYENSFPLSSQSKSWKTLLKTIAAANHPSMNLFDIIKTKVNTLSLFVQNELKYNLLFDLIQIGNLKILNEFILSEKGMPLQEIRSFEGHTLLEFSLLNKNLEALNFLSKHIILPNTQNHVWINLVEKAILGMDEKVFKELMTGLNKTGDEKLNLKYLKERLTTALKTGDLNAIGLLTSYLSDKAQLTLEEWKSMMINTIKKGDIPLLTVILEQANKSLKEKRKQLYDETVTVGLTQMPIVMYAIFDPDFKYDYWLTERKEMKLRIELFKHFFNHPDIGFLSSKKEHFQIAIEYAFKLTNTGMLAEILKNAEDIPGLSFEDSDMNNPLHVMVDGYSWIDSPEATRLLINHYSINPNQRNKEGKIPFFMLLEEGRMLGHTGRCPAEKLEEHTKLWFECIDAFLQRPDFDLSNYAIDKYTKERKNLTDIIQNLRGLSDANIKKLGDMIMARLKEGPRKAPKPVFESKETKEHIADTFVTKPAAIQQKTPLTIVGPKPTITAVQLLKKQFEEKEKEEKKKIEDQQRRKKPDPEGGDKRRPK